MNSSKETGRGAVGAEPSEGRNALLVRQAESLRAETVRARWIRWGMLAGLMMIVVITSMALVNLGRRLKSPENVDKIVDVALERWDARSPEYTREFKGVAERAAPVLADSFARQFQRDLPKFVTSATEQREALADNFAKGFEERVRRRYHEMLERHARVLREQLPAIEDERLHAKVAENISVAVDALVERHYVAQIESTTNELLANWDEFPAADAPRDGESPIQDQLYDAMIDLMAIRLAKAETVSRQSD